MIFYGPPRQEHTKYLKLAAYEWNNDFNFWPQTEHPSRLLQLLVFYQTGR